MQPEDESRARAEESMKVVLTQGDGVEETDEFQFDQLFVVVGGFRIGHL